MDKKISQDLLQIHHHESYENSSFDRFCSLVFTRSNLQRRLPSLNLSSMALPVQSILLATDVTVRCRPFRPSEDDRERGIV